MDKVREEFEKFYSKLNQYGEAHKQELWETWKPHENLLLYSFQKTAKEML